MTVMMTSLNTASLWTLTKPGRENQKSLLIIRSVPVACLACCTTCQTRSQIGHMSPTFWYTAPITKYRNRPPKKL